MLSSPLPRLATLAVALSLACAAHAQSTPDGAVRARSATDLDAVKVIAERTHTDTGALGDRAVRDTRSRSPWSAAKRSKSARWSRSVMPS